jgi:NifU homolog involved in Fe-S cluster formation
MAVAPPLLQAHSLPSGLKGKSLDEAQSISNMQIAEELELPPVKIHCSILAEDAIKAAIDDYKSKKTAK